MNTMELGIRELIYYLGNFHISIPPKSALTTENTNTTDIDRLTSLLKNFHILTSSKGTQESRMNLADIQNLIDLFRKSLISKPSKFIPATINITEVQNPKYFTEIEIASIATVSTGAQGSLPTTSDVTSASSVSSPSSSKLIRFIDFNDRSPEARDARLANLLLSLDEDIPEEVDDTIKTLIKNQTTTTMKFGDHYLEYKQQMATKRLTEKKLPTSAARSSHQNHHHHAITQMPCESSKLRGIMGKPSDSAHRQYGKPKNRTAWKNFTKEEYQYHNHTSPMTGII